ncbi:hypothetical protein NQZ68_005092 [Dissostichus eleginoides]|nr:hypothetical protein NQZ68_005092 [Dissostichus eleginoides]
MVYTVWPYWEPMYERPGQTLHLRDKDELSTSKLSIGLYAAELNGWLRRRHEKGSPSSMQNACQGIGAKRQHSSDSTYSKPHYGFPESHSYQTTQSTDARRGAGIPILTLIPVHVPNHTHTLKTSGALSDALWNAAWRLLTSLNQLAHIIRSFEETPGNAGIPLDIIPVLASVAVSMSKRGSGSAAATKFLWKQGQSLLDYFFQSHSLSRSYGEIIQIVSLEESWRIRDDAAQDKGLGHRLQKGGKMAEAGVKANWKLGPKPGPACHAPGFIQARFKEP